MLSKLVLFNQICNTSSIKSLSTYITLRLIIVRRITNDTLYIEQSLLHKSISCAVIFLSVKYKTMAANINIDFLDSRLYDNKIQGIYTENETRFNTIDTNCHLIQYNWVYKQIHTQSLEHQVHALESTLL